MHFNVFLATLFLLVVVHSFPMREPKWPYPGENPYDIPVAGENVTLLRIGVGSAAIGTQIQNWIYSFQSLKIFNLAQTFVYFQTGINLLTDLGYISREDRPESFITAEQYMNTTLQSMFKNITQYPFSYQPIVFTYNVPGFYQFIQDCPNQCITLSIDVIAQIYMGEITNWNDTRIRKLNSKPTISELNPALNGIPIEDLLPNTTIIPVGYSQREPYTSFVTSTLWSCSERWRKAFPDGPFDQWPVGHPNISSNLKLVSNAYSPVAASYDTVGSLSYTGLPIFNTGGGFYSPYILINHNGGTRLPKKPQADILYKDAYMDKNNVVQGINYNSTKGYPFSAITYIMMVEDTSRTEKYCPKDRGTFLFLRWVLTAIEARTQGEGNGIYFLPNIIHNKVVKQLMRVGCYDDPYNLLDLQVIDDHKAIYFDILLSVDMVIFAIFVLGCLYLTFQNRPTSKIEEKMDRKNKSAGQIVRLYNIILLLGASISYLSIVFFYLVPDNDWVCLTRKWLTGEGISIFLGAMFTRTLQIHRMRNMTLQKTMPKFQSARSQKLRAFLDFLPGVGLSILLQTILLIVWTVVDPLRSDLSVIDDVARTASWVCKSSDHIWIWIGLEIGFFVCLLIYGVWVVFSTWQIKDRFPEAKWLMSSINTTLCAIAALVPIGATVEIKDKQVFIIAAMGITFCISVSLFFLFIDKFEFFILKPTLKRMGIRRRLDDTLTSSSLITTNTTTEATAHTTDTQSHSSHKEKSRSTHEDGEVA